MSQELKSKLKPNTNDTLMHCPEAYSYVAIDSQVCFYRWLFANPVRPRWCITGPDGPLRSTNQNWLCARLLPINGCLNLSCGLCTILLLTGNTVPPSVA